MAVFHPLTVDHLGQAVGGGQNRQGGSIQRLDFTPEAGGEESSPGRQVKGTGGAQIGVTAVGHADDVTQLRLAQHLALGSRDARRLFE